MPRQRVFVIWTHPLFHDAVRLLLRHPKVEICGDSSDHASAQTAIAMIKPDVVVIETPEGEEQAGAETISILQEGPKVVRLNLSDNELSIYLRQQQTVSDAEELLRLIIEDGDDLQG